jgi:tetratricopeptide (TPR) repeat protein
MIRWPDFAAAPALAGVFICIMLTGCATPQVSSLQSGWPDNLPPRAQLADVPFIAQEDHECGPAALGMVLQAAGKPAALDQLNRQVYLPGRQGSLQVELLAASRRNGLPAYVLEPRLSAVLREVAAGNPVLVFQNLSLPIYPVWHYAVIVGYDWNQRNFVLHSGRTALAQMSFATFERTWARAGNWAMVALPAQRVPATASVEAYTQAIAALERVDPQAAGIAYASALTHWPDQPTLLLGLGNAAYAQGDWNTAQLAYTQAVNTHPEFADGWNNLAQLRLERGEPALALEAIAHAIELGGPRLPRYLELRQRIEKP